MSPLAIRRYRAERLLRDDFEALRGRVLAKVHGRLRASGVRLDAADLDACYGQAWQGLYTSLLAGEQIDSPAGWLVVVTFRRAIEEHRARLRSSTERCDLAPADAARLQGGCGQERDLAAEIDDRARLRHLFEGLRGRLGAREREAAALCYLQGLSRSQAAARMGVSEARMRKLMDGCRAGQPGVAGKVGALVDTIRAGDWCEEQGSLMRGLAYGILDPDGERHRLAVIHRRECPACRAYVASLRGLAAVLPPVFLPSALGAAALTLGGSGAHAGATGGALGGPFAGGALRVGAGAGSMSAGAGAGGAGGGWVLAAGPLGAKLAVGCALALGVGAGCVALGGGLAQPHSNGHSGRPSLASRPPARPGTRAVEYGQARVGGSAARVRATAPAVAPARRQPGRSQPGGAGREFSPERVTGTSASPEPEAAITTVSAHSAAAPAATAPGAQTGRPTPPAAESAAQREFAPG